MELGISRIGINHEICTNSTYYPMCLCARIYSNKRHERSNRTTKCPNMPNRPHTVPIQIVSHNPFTRGLFLSILKSDTNKLCQFYITKICYSKSLTKCRKHSHISTKRNKSKSQTKDLTICANRQSGTQGVEINSLFLYIKNS